MEKDDPIVRPRHLARHGAVPAPDQSLIGNALGGARHGRVVTTAVRRPVRPATRGMRVVAMASARVISGRIVVRRRASLDVPAPGGPRSSRTLGAERRHEFPLYP